MEPKIDLSQMLYMDMMIRLTEASDGEQPQFLDEATAATRQLWDFLYPGETFPAKLMAVYFTPVWEKVDPHFSDCCRARTGPIGAPDSLFRVHRGLPIVHPAFEKRVTIELNVANKFEYTMPSESMPDWFWDKWESTLNQFGVISTVAHEIVHVRNPEWNHDERFWLAFDHNLSKLSGKEATHLTEDK
jgi:hypothetical protein